MDRWSCKFRGNAPVQHIYSVNIIQWTYIIIRNAQTPFDSRLSFIKQCLALSCVIISLQIWNSQISQSAKGERIRKRWRRRWLRNQLTAPFFTTVYTLYNFYFTHSQCRVIWSEHFWSEQFQMERFAGWLECEFHLNGVRVCLDTRSGGVCFCLHATVVYSIGI